MTSDTRTARTVEIARALGFDLCGIAPATEFPELVHLEEWLERGYAGEMRYLHNARRESPSLAMDSARSVIMCALNYNTSFPSSIEAVAESRVHILAPGLAYGSSDAGPRGWISRYGWGDDYHNVLGEKLEAIIQNLRQEFQEPFEARAYVDTGPIVERVAAKYAGLGWLAKNTCLINEDIGSWFFLGVIVTTLDLAPSLGPAEPPAPDLCGNCTLCIDACPTGAIVEPYVLDARRCISYLTIELRGTIPEEFRAAIGRHVFGCDICQDVCPWNRRAPLTGLPNFLPRQFYADDDVNGSMRGEASNSINIATNNATKSLFSPDLEWLVSLTEDQFREFFRGNPVKRTKWRGLVRNTCIAIGNSGLRPGDSRYGEICARLLQLTASTDAILAEHAQWALDRIGFSSGLPQASLPEVVPPTGQR